MNSDGFALAVAEEPADGFPPDHGGLSPLPHPARGHGDHVFEASVALLGAAALDEFANHVAYSSETTFITTCKPLRSPSWDTARADFERNGGGIVVRSKRPARRRRAPHPTRA